MIELPWKRNKQEAPVDPFLQELIMDVAGRGHESWREGYKANPQNQNADGTHKPRPKLLNETKGFETANEEWLQKNRHTPNIESALTAGPEGIKVDIVALSFRELPPERQAESKASARVAFEEIARYAKAGKDAMKYIEEIAAKVHEAWIKRNKPRVERDIWKKKNEWDKLADKSSEEAMGLQKGVDELKIQLLDYNADDFPEYEKKKDRDDYVLPAIEAYRTAVQRQRDTYVGQLKEEAS